MQCKSFKDQTYKLTLPRSKWVILSRIQDNLAGQLCPASSPSPAHHCQIVSANSLLPSCRRTTQHGQFAMGTTHHGQPEGGWAEHRVVAAAAAAAASNYLKNRQFIQQHLAIEGRNKITVLKLLLLQSSFSIVHRMWANPAWILGITRGHRRHGSTACNIYLL